MRPNYRIPRLLTRRNMKRLPTAVITVAAVSIAAIGIACSSERASVATDSMATPTTPARNDVANQSALAREQRRGVIGGADGRDEMKVSTESSEADQAVAAPPAAPMPASPITRAQAVSQTPTATSMIIRTGHAGIEVDSLDAAIARVRALAQRVGGFVANTAVQGGKDQLRSASLEVKIPSDRFDDALAGLSPIGKVESVNVNAEDVGEEYVDIAARVENAHRLEARLIALLANRTGKLQEVLSVERELARVREEIERYEGRLRFLRARVAMSTLTINVHERAPIIVPVAGDGPIMEAFRDAWRNFVGLVAAFIASLGVLIPLGAMAFLGWLVVRRWAPWRGVDPTPPAPGA
jgi:hypothetical protein